MMCNCGCAEKLKETLDNAISQRNDAYKVFQQWEGAVIAIEQLIPVLFPLDSPAPNVIDVETT